MKLGIIQGRLLEPVGGNIQEFSFDRWEDEFELINKLNLNHIEWIITDNSFNNNVLSINISKYHTKVSSICCDQLIHSTITNIEFLKKQILPVCEWAINNQIKIINIPLLEASELNENNKHILISNFQIISDLFPDLEFHFEIESSIDLCLELVSTRNNFFLIYDTGNITSKLLDHVEWIIKGHKYIKNVHLKDRTISPIKTVEPFTGDTDFKTIFETLRSINYNNFFTIQTCRGETGREIDTIKNHIKKFVNLYNEKFI